MRNQVILFMLLVTLSAKGADWTLDQEFSPNRNFVRLDTQVGAAPHAGVGQSFTPDLSGRLDGLEMWILALGAGEYPTLKVDVRKVSTGGFPSGSALGTLILPPSSITSQSSEFKRIDLTSLNIQVEKGRMYGVFFTVHPLPPPFADRGVFDFRGHDANELGAPGLNYAGGIGLIHYGSDNGGWQLYSGDGFDFVFRTFVTVPEPGTLALFALSSLVFSMGGLFAKCR